MSNATAVGCRRCRRSGVRSVSVGCGYRRCRRSGHRSGGGTRDGRRGGSSDGDLCWLGWRGRRGGSGNRGRSCVGQATHHSGPLFHVAAAEPGAVRDHAAAVYRYLGRLFQYPKVGDGFAHREGDFVGVTLPGLQVLLLVGSLRRVNADPIELDPVRKPRGRCCSDAVTRRGRSVTTPSGRRGTRVSPPPSAAST